MYPLRPNRVGKPIIKIALHRLYHNLLGLLLSSCLCKSVKLLPLDLQHRL